MDITTLGVAMAYANKAAKAAKPTAEELQTAVDNWLDDHPEVTTTVEDGAITKAKLDSSLQGTVDDVDELKSTLNKIVAEKTGISVEIEADADVPNSLTVSGLAYSQGDITDISPTSPVTITGVTSGTITVNDADTEVDFTDANANGIGGGTWDVLAGKITDAKPIITVTDSMVNQMASAGGGYAADLNIGISITKIEACSHYKISTYGTAPRIAYVNGHIYLYDSNFTSDKEAAKTYLNNLGMKLVVAAQTAVVYDVTAGEISLASGANEVSTDVGTMTIKYGIDVKTYVDNAVDEVEDTADSASATATEAITKATANSTALDIVDGQIYKFATKNASNTGTGGASGASTIAWGTYVALDTDIEKCWSLTITPQFNNNTGTYTATRWKNASGNALANGEMLIKVGSPITKNKGEAVTFDKVGIGEFISIEPSAGNCQRTGESASGIAPLSYVNPQTGLYTKFDGYLSGRYAMVTYKPVKDDSMLLFNKNITLIGDSITEKNGRANVNHGMWLERWTGCNFQNLGRGGTGFSAGKQASINYATRISSIDEDVDIIGVAASLNDMGHTLGTPADTIEDGTVCGYANDFFDTLLTAFPTARIACYSEGPWYNYKPGVTASDNYVAAIKQICENKGITFDDALYRGCALRPWIEANCEVYYKGESGDYTDVVDNIHPNSAGQKVIARYLEKLFETMTD